VIPIDTGSRVIEGGVVLKESPLLRSLGVLFEQFWAQATPYPAAAVRGDGAGAGRDAQTPSDVDRRILALLAAGQKDGTIARQLGLGHSTVERRVRRLLDRLGARSRFQAGVQAQRRGWLDVR
jgi:DNA-binding CsgD family transcriptional regulator